MDSVTYKLNQRFYEDDLININQLTETTFQDGIIKECKFDRRTFNGKSILMVTNNIKTNKEQRSEFNIEAGTEIDHNKYMEECAKKDNIIGWRTDDTEKIVC